MPLASPGPIIFETCCQWPPINLTFVQLLIGSLKHSSKYIQVCNYQHLRPNYIMAWTSSASKSSSIAFIASLICISDLLTWLTYCSYTMFEAYLSTSVILTHVDGDYSKTTIQY